MSSEASTRAELPDIIDDLDPKAQERFRQLQRLSHVLDSQFAVPGTQRSFGVDGLIGLIPWFGSAPGLALSAVVIGQGIMIGARGATVARMVVNAVVDALLGLIPIIGTISDFVFKANERNVRLLSTHTLDPDRTRAESARMLTVTMITIAVAILGTIAVGLIGLIALFRYLF